MKTVTVNLNSIEKVKSFVNDIVKYENDFDLVSGRNYVDAKSIMAFDLSKPLQLNIHANDNCDEITKSLKNYLC